MKLIADEAECDALTRWLSAAAEAQITSELSQVEVSRFCLRGYENALRAARDLLDGMRIIPLTRGVIDLASSAGLTSLRSLDAIHLASALTVGPELSAFVAYGRRRQAAAADEGLPVMAPA